MRAQLRIVSGSLRGRKINCQVSPDLRPTPQMVREALFSILGNAVPDRPFFDVFAGTGANGLEALSRGGSFAYFIERDFRLAQDIVNHLKAFGVADRAQVVRTDVYRWAGQWQAPPEPVNVFISPPFADFERRLDDLLTLSATVESKVAEGSVLVVQTERPSRHGRWPHFDDWEERRYGRNVLLLRVKETSPVADGRAKESPA
jgi:16S rRNA (guanine(966)-N(2))-methyltransferase RsmD